MRLHAEPWQIGALFAAIPVAAIIHVLATARYVGLRSG